MEDGRILITFFLKSVEAHEVGSSKLKFGNNNSSNAGPTNMDTGTTDLRDEMEDLVNELAEQQRRQMDHQQRQMEFQQQQMQKQMQQQMEFMQQMMQNMMRGQQQPQPAPDGAISSGPSFPWDNPGSASPTPETPVSS